MVTLKTGFAYPLQQSVLKNAKLVDATSVDDMIAKKDRFLKAACDKAAVTGLTPAP